MSRPEKPTRRATALRYEGRDAPKVVATGGGLVADSILEAARGRHPAAPGSGAGAGAGDA
ncbi:MAG: hypothetical protein QOE17_2445 [Gaiellales bacterium]|nr:hypothetical protein [Gaiellales bacterium]